MKISKSKQELARIISENGGWDQLANLAFYGNFTGECFMIGTDEYPIYDSATKVFYINERDVVRSFKSKPFKNWHQTILSRAEYFHLYPALGELCGKVTEENRHEQVWTNPPSIEQLAADYRAKLAIATQAQEEADSHRCGAEVALSKLEIAAKELGFKIEPITARQEAELLITDWRQWKVGDYVSWSIISRRAEFKIISVHHDESREIGDFEITDEDGYVFRCYGDECKFIRRP